jgi:hypothetical protein
MPVLYGRAMRLTTLVGGLRPGQKSKPSQLLVRLKRPARGGFGFKVASDGVVLTVLKRSQASPGRCCHSALSLAGTKMTLSPRAIPGGGGGHPEESPADAGRRASGCGAGAWKQLPGSPTVRARPARLSGLSVSCGKSSFYGAFVWVRWALNYEKWVFGRGRMLDAPPGTCVELLFRRYTAKKCGATDL